MIAWAPGPNAVFEWTQDWIQTLNKAEEGKAPTFTIASKPASTRGRSPVRGRSGGSWSIAGKSILRNGAKKKSVSWSKTIQVETFQSDECREDIPESGSESDESVDDLVLVRSDSMDNDDTDITMGDDGGDSIPNITDGDGIPNIIEAASDESDEDIFADVFDLVAASSTISDEDATMGDAIMEDVSKTPSRENIKASNVFIPVLVPDNSRIENRLGRADSGSFCTVSEDDWSLISNIDDTVSLVRRAASDDESIVSLRRRNKEYDDTKQRDVDGILGQIGIVLPLPSMKGLWSVLGVDEVAPIEAVSKAEEDVKEARRTSSVSEAESEDVSEAASDMATLSKDFSKSQEELGVDWLSQTTTTKKKSRFGRLTTNRKKTVDNDGVPKNNKRGLFKKRRKRSNAAPQLMVC